MEEDKDRKKIEEGKEEAGRSDKGGRRGRPTNVVMLRKERSVSVGSMVNLEEIWMRKREERGAEEEVRKKTGEWMDVQGKQIDGDISRKEEREKGRRIRGDKRYD